MIIRKIALATAAIGLAAAPVMAETSVERTQPVAEASEMGLGGGNAIFYVLGLAAIVAGAILLLDDDDDDSLSA